MLRNANENIATEAKQADQLDVMHLLQGLAFLGLVIEQVNGASGAWASTGPALRVALNSAQPLGTVAQVTLVPNVTTVGSVTSLANQVAEGGVATNYNVYNTALENERALMARI